MIQETFIRLSREELVSLLADYYGVVFESFTLSHQGFKGVLKNE